MKPLFPLACLAVLSACAAQRTTRYPSLLPRPIESRGDAEPAVSPPAAAAQDAALDARVAAIKASLDGAIAAFTPAAARAQRSSAAAKGAAAGSERWIAAQTDLAELDGYRSTTSAAVTDLEQLEIERATADQPDYPAVEALRPVAEKALADQTARIAAIQAALAN